MSEKIVLIGDNRSFGKLLKYLEETKMEENKNILTDEQLDSVVNTAIESTPEEVKNMRDSINNAEEISKESEAEYEEEIRNISLESSYSELLCNENGELPESDADIFQIAENGEAKLKLSDEDVAARLKDNASQVLDIPDEDMVKFCSIMMDFRRDSSSHKDLYHEMPESIKKMIRSLANEQGVPFTAYNDIAKMFMSEFISQAELDEVFVDIEKSLDEALKMPTISDLYSEHTRSVMDEKIPELIEKIKDEEPERAKLLENIRTRFYEAYSLENLKVHFNETARTRKLMRRDWEDPIKFCDEFNLKNTRSKFKMPDCRSIGPALTRVFIEEEHDEESRIAKMQITIKDLNKFAILFCRHCMNMDPSDILDASYMYYSLKNITMLNLTNETKTSFAVELINNICDIIEFIREKEAEFDGANNGKQRKHK